MNGEMAIFQLPMQTGNLINENTILPETKVFSLSLWHQVFFFIGESVSVKNILEIR